MESNAMEGDESNQEHLLAWGGAAAFHQDRPVGDVDIKEVHLAVRCFKVAFIGYNDMAIVHVALIRPLFL